MQSYQEVSIEVLKELPNVKSNPQHFFFCLKQKNPKRFERLYFDTNGHNPFSEDLSNILFDLKS
jgi:hypothetical protein